MTAAIIVHGGAGLVEEARLGPCRAGCERAAEAGWAVLAAGGDALDAVGAAVAVLEDDPEFNAGRGAVLNREGAIEVDAAVMDGRLRVGAVGAVPWLRHPAALARKVLEAGEHVLLVGEGALAFAREHGIEPELPEVLVTERARRRHEEELARRRSDGTAGARSTGATMGGPAGGSFAGGDTVGACAIDLRGRVASATSTGGTAGKRRGRVGDSPIPGAGTYADDAAGAASATGHGESILRVLMARGAVAQLQAGAPPEAAARAAVADLASRVGGAGGIILVDHRGRVGQARNTSTMPWASVTDGRREAGH